MEGDGVRVEVRSEGGRALHVEGAGVSGLAPKRTGALEPGAHVFELVGDHGKARATLRVVRKGRRLDATVGSPDRWYDVTCDGKALGATPVTLPLEKRLRCRLVSPDGPELAFDLRRIDP
jgi:hypothetical protein